MKRHNGILSTAICGLLFFGLTDLALAGWQTGNFVDRMTDRKESYARVNDAEGRASLYVGCMNGSIFPQIEFPQRIGVGQVGLSYRFDDEPVMPRFAAVSGDGTSIWLWIANGPEMALKIRHSKRLRVQMNSTFLDFDLSGADGAIKDIRCK
jgi:hypothetical protein